MLLGWRHFFFSHWCHVSVIVFFSLPHPAPPYQMCEELLLLPRYTHFPNSLSFAKNKDDVTFSLH